MFFEYFSYKYYIKRITKCQELFLGLSKILLDLWLKFVYNITMDIYYLIILIASNMFTYFYTKEVVIKQTIDFLERTGMLEFDDDTKNSS